MKYKKLLYITYLSCTTVVASHAADKSCQPELDKFKCLEFVKNYDGDTATFNVPHLHPLLGKELNISLADVKSPSIYSRNKCEKKLAKQTKIEVRKILKEAKYIEAENVKRDKKFGVKGNIIIDGKDLAKTLLKRKMAVPAKQYKGTNWSKLG